MRMQKLFLLFLFAAGFVLLSATFRSTQNPEPRDLPPQRPENTLTERQRVYLDRHTELNKWLIALSYAILVGLTTKRIANADDPRFSSFACSLGGMLLVLSLYAGFLSYESVLIVMSSKPLSNIGAPITAYPIVAQMIFLAVATAVLAYAFLGPAALTTAQRRDK